MLTSFIKKFCPPPFKQKIELARAAPDSDTCLAAMKRRGFHPKTAIDVGAYAGEWTISLRHLFPDTRVLMIEPQASQRERLEALTQVHDGVEFARALLGPAAADRVTFYQTETGRSVLRDPGNAGAQSAAVKMTTLDAVVRTTPFGRADFLKLDVQGYELEVLKGAEQVLASVEAVMMEVNPIEVCEGAPVAYEAVAFMAVRGFRVYDFCTLFRRPSDYALWQTAMVFVRATSPLMGYTRWA
jgi:FkbM family methyltransferase